MIRQYCIMRILHIQENVSGNFSLYLIGMKNAVGGITLYLSYLKQERISRIKILPNNSHKKGEYLSHQQKIYKFARFYVSKENTLHLIATRNAEIAPLYKNTSYFVCRKTKTPYQIGRGWQK
jgi:hypothetical protein